MALSNWDTLAVNEKGEPTNGVFTSPLGVSVSIYKNWLYISDKTAWREGCGYVEHTVMEIMEGSIRYMDVHIEAKRGPQNGVYAVVWVEGYKYAPRDESTDHKLVEDAFDQTKYPDRGMVGCGVYGFENESGDWVGVKLSSLMWFRETMADQHEEVIAWASGGDEDGKGHPIVSMVHKWSNIPDWARAMGFGEAVRFNQGDAFFAEKGSIDPNIGTKPGEAVEPALMQAIKQMAEDKPT